MAESTASRCLEFAPTGTMMGPAALTACGKLAGHDGPCSWDRDVTPERCEIPASITLGDWECKREAGHDGPCAAVAVFPDRRATLEIVDIELCASSATFYDCPDWRGEDDPHEVRCLLGRGHDGPHAGAVSWT